MTYLGLIREVGNQWIVDLFLKGVVTKAELAGEVGSSGADLVIEYKEEKEREKKMKKRVTLQIEVSVIAEGDTEVNLLANAEKKVVEQMKERFPRYTYRISDEDGLTLEEALPGMIVEADNGSIGIIYERKPNRKFPIGVVLSSGKKIDCMPDILKKSSATFEEAKSKRVWPDEWVEGNAGYFKTKNDIVEVIIGKCTKSVTEAYIINDGRYYKLNAVQVKRLSDEKQ